MYCGEGHRLGVSRHGGSIALCMREELQLLCSEKASCREEKATLFSYQTRRFLHEEFDEFVLCAASEAAHPRVRAPPSCCLLTPLRRFFVVVVDEFCYLQLFRFLGCLAFTCYRTGNLLAVCSPSTFVYPIFLHRDQWVLRGQQ